IKLLRKHGYTVTALAVLSKRTSEWTTEFFALAKELDLQGMNFTRFIAEGAGQKLFSSGGDRPLNPVELKDALCRILLASAQFQVDTFKKVPLFHLIHPSLGGYGHFGRSIIIDYRGNLKISSRVD